MKSNPDELRLPIRPAERGKSYSAGWSATVPVARFNQLQWGRVQLNAESVCDRDGRAPGEYASMGPRSAERGKKLSLGGALRLTLGFVVKRPRRSS